MLAVLQAAKCQSLEGTSCTMRKRFILPFWAPSKVVINAITAIWDFNRPNMWKTLGEGESSSRAISPKHCCPKLDIFETFASTIPNVAFVL